MTVLEIARVSLLRVLRDRGNLFFVFLMPLIIILAMGLAFGGSGHLRLGVVRAGAGPLGDALVEAVTQADLEVELRERATIEELRSDVEAGRLDLGLVVPAGYDAALRGGQDVRLGLVAAPGSLPTALRQIVEAAIAGQSSQVRAARVAASQAGMSFEPALDLARGQQAAVGGITVRTTTVGQATLPTTGNPFALGAQGQTVLFMFLTSMTAASQLLLTRQLGVLRRMLSTPTPVRAILLGELLGRFAVAMVQGLVIVLVSALLFGVSWGQPAAAAALIVFFALVGTGAAMTVGAFARTVDQASAVGMVLGLLLAALGGAMVPLEFFSPPMSELAYLTPHAWAIDGFRDLVFHGADTAAILIQLSVLACYAAALVVVGTWGLRRSLTR